MPRSLSVFSRLIRRISPPRQSDILSPPLVAIVGESDSVYVDYRSRSQDGKFAVSQSILASLRISEEDRDVIRHSFFQPLIPRIQKDGARHVRLLRCTLLIDARVKETINITAEMAKLGLRPAVFPEFLAYVLYGTPTPRPLACIGSALIDPRQPAEGYKAYLEPPLDSLKLARLYEPWPDAVDFLAAERD